MEDKILSEEAKNDEKYMAYLKACREGGASIEDFDSNQYPRSYEHFYRYKGTTIGIEFQQKWH